MLTTSRRCLALTAAAVLGLGVAPVASSAATVPDVTITARAHYSSANGRANGVDFTVCNVRRAPVTTDSSGFRDDYALVTLRLYHGTTPDRTRYQLGAYNTGVQHCATTLNRVSTYASITAFVTYHHDGVQVQAYKNLRIRSRA